MALTKEDLQAIAELMDARLDAKLDAKLTSALAPINQRLDTMQEDISSMQTRMDRMEDSIDSLKKDMTVMQDNVNSLKKDMAHHNHHVEPLLNAIKEGIDGLQERNKQVDRLEARVEDHGHRIFALEQVARTTR